MASAAKSAGENTSSPPFGQDTGKRPRACEACRRLKSQCIFSTNTATSCARCLKNSRPCVMTTRKPRARLPPNLGALERKIRSLVDEVAQLKAIQKESTPADEDLDPESLLSRLTSSVAASLGAGSSLSGVTDHDHDFSTPFTGSSGSESMNATVEMPRAFFPDNRLGIITSGGLSEELALEAFDHFTKHILVEFPILVIPPEITAAEMRTVKPVLFLAILNAASGLFARWMQDQLNRELTDTFARLILVEGTKSLELVQALQIHCASVMAIEIGISRKRPPQPSNPVGQSEPSSGRRVTCAVPESIETRRAWLGCYFLSAQVAQNLRHENLIRWSTYLDECLKVLEMSSINASDRTLCSLIRLQHIADDIGNQFSVADPSSSRSLDDVGLQFTMQSFENRLNNYRNQTEEDVRSEALRIAELFTRIYLHEVALHSGSSSDDMQPPFTEVVLADMKPTSPGVLSSSHVKSLSACLTNIYEMLDAFLLVSLDKLRCQPVFQFVRLVYALVVLVKINLGSSSREGPGKGVFMGSSQHKIRGYIDNLLARLNMAAEGDRCAAAAKFGEIVASIRSGFGHEPSPVWNARTFESALRSSDPAATPAHSARNLPMANRPAPRSATTFRPASQTTMQGAVAHDQLPPPVASTTLHAAGNLADFSFGSWMDLDNTDFGLGPMEDVFDYGQVDDGALWYNTQK